MTDEPDTSDLTCPTCGVTGSLGIDPDRGVKTTNPLAWPVRCTACGDAGHVRVFEDDQPPTFCCFRGYEYRVVRETCGGTTFLSVREVYPDGRVDAEPSPPAGATLEDIKADMIAMMGALERGVVEYAEDAEDA